MLNRIRKDDQGFTLIELLVVILIIGILAAIALPAFLGQRAKGQDSSAKSDARNSVSELESCYVETQDYSAATCGQAALTAAGLPNATFTASGTQGYSVAVESKSGNTFTIAKNATTNVITRSCTITGNSLATPGTDKGGCNGGSW